MRVIVRSRALGRLRDMLRAVRQRNWTFAKALLAVTWYGLTHGLCSTCSLDKGLNVDRDCHKCRTNKLINNLFN